MGDSPALSAVSVYKAYARYYVARNPIMRLRHNTSNVPSARSATELPLSPCGRGGRGVRGRLPRDIHVPAFLDRFLHLRFHAFGNFLGGHPVTD